MPLWVLVIVIGGGFGMSGFLLMITRLRMSIIRLVLNWALRKATTAA